VDGKFVWAADQVSVDDTGCGLNCGENAMWSTALTGVYSAEVNLTYPATGDGYAGIIFAYRNIGGGYAWFSCGLYRNGAGNASDFQAWNYPGTGTNIFLSDEVQDAEAGTTSHTAIRRIRAYYNGAGFYCTFDNSVGESAVLTPNVAIVGNLDGLAGFRAYDEHAIFLSFVAYE
jgi:hypothetical protein